MLTVVRPFPVDWVGAFAPVQTAVPPTTPGSTSSPPAPRPFGILGRAVAGAFGLKPALFEAAAAAAARAAVCIACTDCTALVVRMRLSRALVRAAAAAAAVDWVAAAARFAGLPGEAPPRRMSPAIDGTGPGSSKAAIAKAAKGPVRSGRRKEASFMRRRGRGKAAAQVTERLRGAASRGRSH